MVQFIVPRRRAPSSRLPAVCDEAVVRQPIARKVTVVVLPAMWIRDVDVPEALIGAHRRGDLVIFVGAGASRGSPSDLPDFQKLTADIAADGNVPVTDEQLDQPDVLLGDLEDHHHVDVHVRVAARIGVSSSQPNRLHAAIGALAVAGPPARIVTTNYDIHLSRVLAASGLSVTEYMAPALPMGDDFTGLVYLHGSLQQSPRALVVTDADFGRAYLRDAWATRFLERMFATYTVLFVGYSHNDVVMSYLARGLGPASARFVLTAEPQNSNWRRLRIHPVGYPNVDGFHDALTDAIAGWASWASMGFLDHRQRVAQLVSAPPSQVPEEASYLDSVVADRDKVRFFAEHARGEEWLSWAAGQPEFRRLFDESAATTGCTAPLAYWFAEHYVMDEDLTAAALSVVREAGGRLGPAVWSAIGHHLHVRKGARPTWLAPWLVLLVENAPEMTSDWLEYVLVASRWPEDRVEALLLFDHLTEPQAILQPSFGLDEAPRFDVRLRGNSQWLQEAWANLFVPNLAEAAPEILLLADGHLRRAHRILTAAGAARPGWDSLTFRRSAIEPHPQDSIRGPVDVLIDAARDCVEVLLDDRPDLGTAYLQAWAATEAPLLRRLAAHGWMHRGDVDATLKLAWLRERGWLFDHQVRHEVFRLIAMTLPHAAPDVADALVADVMGGPDNDSDHRDYAIYNALVWITRHAPGLQSARIAFEQVKVEHPEYQERQYPDLRAWSESGVMRGQPPMTTEILHHLIETDADAAIAELRQYENATSSFDGPTWEDALSVLAEVIGDRPTDGFAVLDVEAGEHPDVVRATIRGWAAATVDDDLATSIVNRLGSMELLAVADDVARLLADGGRSEATPTEWHRIPAARDLAGKVWTAIESRAPSPAVDDWLTSAINKPAGWLAQFWLHAIAADWREAGDSWMGLPTGVRHQLEVLLGGDDNRTAAAEVIFASQLHFFYGADRDWSERNVLPLLDWADPVRARRTWDGFLSWGRWNNQLLGAGLLNQYLATARHIGQFRDDIRRQLCRHLAAVAIYSEVDPIANGWVRTFTATVDVAVRTEWMDQIGWLLRDLPLDAIEHQWQRWIRQYWTDRLESVPIQLTVDEASAMASWVVYLPVSTAEGVTLATAYPGRLAKHSNLVRDLIDERIGRAPADFAVLLAHLLRGTQPPFYGGYKLKNVVQLLRGQAAPNDVTAIVEQAVRLGCNDAATW